MKELYQSISMDEGRIKIIEHYNDICIVTKKTIKREVINTAEMNTHLQNTKQFEWQNELYKVVTPKIIFWDQAKGTLGLELKKGNNLEALLSSTEGNRTQNINFTHQFLEWMKTTGTFWRGVAPRHIIINYDQKEISLLDFERPINLKPDGFDNEEFNNMLRGLVHEEFCAFLFEDEQQVVFPDIWKTKELNKTIPLSVIHGKRVKLLLEKLFGPFGESVQTEQLHFVYRFMSSIITPFFIEGKPFYPLKAIDKKTKGAESYVDILLQLCKMDKPQWPRYLEG